MWIQLREEGSVKEPACKNNTKAERAQRGCWEREGPGPRATKSWVRVASLDSMTSQPGWAQAECKAVPQARETRDYPPKAPQLHSLKGPCNASNLINLSAQPLPSTSVFHTFAAQD